MSTPEHPQVVPHNTHTTHIGNITGQVHTGSGDINVGQFLANDSIRNKEDFLALLQQMKTTLAAARQEGVADDTVDDALTEFEAAEREVQKDQPKSERILKRLESAKAILTSGAGVATAAMTVAAVLRPLVPLLEKAIEVVKQIF